MSACILDGTPTGDGAQLCLACSADLTQVLAELPALLDDVDLTLSRQSAQGQRHGGRSSEKALPYDVRASETLGDARVKLAGWVQVHHRDGEVLAVTEGPVCEPCTELFVFHPSCGAILTPKRWLADPWPRDTPQDMARWLYTRVHRIRHHEAADQLLTELRDASRALERVADLAFYRARFPVGPCINAYEDGSECNGEIWALVPADESRPAKMRCQKCEHEWPSDQWLRAGREILRMTS